tara:strand:+ start:962 stop:1330 length:369 start_codon:yes stop_codon:yes gene_type:complete
MNKKNEHAYKTIGEVAEMLNLINIKNGSLSTHTLRYWEREFKQIRPKVLAGNRRYYDHRTVEVIKRVKYLLKDKGMTIQGVRKYLDNDETYLDDSMDININTKNILKRKLNKISNIIKELKK